MISPDERAKLALRAVTAADTDFMAGLYASTRTEEMKLVDWSEQQKRDFLQMQFAAQSKYYAEQFDDARFEIIERDGEPIGRLYVTENDGDIHVIDIALLPEFRGRGIGEHYLQGLIDRAAASGRGVTIHVEFNNPAMHLYERIGFEKVEEVGIYWFMRAQPAAPQENTAS